MIDSKMMAAICFLAAGLFSLFAKPDDIFTYVKCGAAAICFGLAMAALR